MRLVLSKCRVLLLILTVLSTGSSALAADSPSPAVLQGYEFLTKRSYSQAISVLSGAVRANPRDVMARRYLGVALHQSGMSGAGAQQLEMVVRLEPGNANDLALLADMYLLSGEHSRAISTFKGCLSLSPANEQARCGLARAYYGAGDSANARNACIDGLKTCRNSGARKQLVRILGDLRTEERQTIEADSRG